MGIVLFGDQILSDRERKNLALLEIIRKDGPISRVDISKTGGQNLVTVSSYVDNFVKSGLVFEKGLDISSGGRPPTLVELNADAGFALGVGVDTKNAICLVTDLKVNRLGRVKKDISGVDEDQLPRVTGDIADETMEKAKIDRTKMKGLGLGIDGAIEQRRIVVYKDYLENRFHTSVFIDSMITLSAFSEKWLTVDPAVRNLLYIYAGRGCGIILNRQVYRGTNLNAGNLGILTKKGDSFICQKGDLCFFAQGESDLGIVAHAQVAIAEGESSLISEFLKEKEKVTLEEVIEAANRGDKLSIRLIGEAGRRLGIKIAFLVNLLNPELIVIGGGLEKAGSLLFDAVEAAIRDRSDDVISGGVEVIPSRLGEDGAALGGVGLVIQNTFISVG